MQRFFRCSVTTPCVRAMLTEVARIDILSCLWLAHLFGPLTNQPLDFWAGVFWQGVQSNARNIPFIVDVALLYGREVLRGTPSYMQLLHSTTDLPRTCFDRMRGWLRAIVLFTTLDYVHIVRIHTQNGTATVWPHASVSGKSNIYMDSLLMQFAQPMTSRPMRTVHALRLLSDCVWRFGQRPLKRDANWYLFGEGVYAVMRFVQRKTLDNETELFVPSVLEIDVTYILHLTRTVGTRSLTASTEQTCEVLFQVLRANYRGWCVELVPVCIVFFTALFINANCNAWNTPNFEPFYNLLCARNVAFWKRMTLEPKDFASQSRVVVDFVLDLRKSSTFQLLLRKQAE